LADHEPWKLIKTDAHKTAEIMQFAYEVLCNLCLASEIFLPNTFKKLQIQLGIEFNDAQKASFWQKAEWFSPETGGKIGELSLLFAKMEDDIIEGQITKLQSSLPQETTPAAVESKEEVVIDKPLIQYDDFAKLDLRIATVVKCEKVEKADKLLNLTLSLGNEERTVLSGIAMHFTPEECVGQQVLYLANLSPRKMRGIESHGMILMAEDSHGKLHFVRPSTEINAGAGVA
jgi:methionyl-tRNA synthetase